MINRSKSIKNVSCFKMKLLLLIGISLTLLLPLSSNAAVMEDYCVVPPYVSIGGNPPNILPILDNAYIMGTQAYVDYAEIEIAGDGIGDYDNEYGQEYIVIAQDIGTNTTAPPDEDKTKLSDFLGEMANIYKQKQALAKEREDILEKQEKLSKQIEKAEYTIYPVDPVDIESLISQSDALQEKIKDFNERLADIEKKEESVRSKNKSLEEKESTKEATPDI